MASREDPHGDDIGAMLLQYARPGDYKEVQPSTACSPWRASNGKNNQSQPVANASNTRS